MGGVWPYQILLIGNLVGVVGGVALFGGGVVVVLNFVMFLYYSYGNLDPKSTPIQRSDREPFRERHP